MIDYESQSARTLLAIADRRGGAGAARCRLVFDHLAAAARLRRSLQRALTRHQLSELQFATLVVLSEAEPEPVPMAVLAEHAAVSRPAMTESLDKLEAQHWASRSRDRNDRRSIQVRITAAGREKVDRAIDDYLRAVVAGVEELEPARPRAGLFSLSGARAPRLHLHSIRSK